MIGPILITLCVMLAGAIAFLWMKLKKAKQELAYTQSFFQSEKIQISSRFEEELSHTKQKLKEAESLAMVARQSENAIMLMDAQGNILWTNDSFTRMYEYSYEEFTKALGDNIRKTSFSGEINERLRRCFTHKRAVNYDAPNITKTGKEIWTRTSLIPLLNESNEVVGLVTIDSDIDARVRVGEKLIEYIKDFNKKTELISEQLNVMVDMTNALFERIDISQQRIERTDEIINFIKRISDQTKILGINASIEAHSAGEAGRGFRIIANEIVSISNITLNSLKEIYELINKIQRSSDKMTTVRERSESAIGNHRSLVTELKREINEAEEMVLQLK
jgi:PAS domain S-box-containing protein